MTEFNELTCNKTLSDALLRHESMLEMVGVKKNAENHLAYMKETSEMLQSELDKGKDICHICSILAMAVVTSIMEVSSENES